MPSSTGPIIYRRSTATPTLLTMLWQNLIGNALKFTRPPDTTPKVTITAEQSDGMWRVCVQDNGIGVPEEFAEKIFVIFQRLHAREEYSGTGIGLALCKKIVEYHGGTIALDTTSYIGARFCLTLPVAGEDPHRHRPRRHRHYRRNPPMNPPSPTPSTSCSWRTILVMS